MLIVSKSGAVRAAAGSTIERDGSAGGTVGSVVDSVQDAEELSDMLARSERERKAWEAQHPGESYARHAGIQCERCSDTGVIAFGRGRVGFCSNCDEQVRKFVREYRVEKQKLRFAAVSPKEDARPAPPVPVHGDGVDRRAPWHNSLGISSSVGVARQVEIGARVRVETERDLRIAARALPDFSADPCQWCGATRGYDKSRVGALVFQPKGISRCVVCRGGKY